MAVKTIAELLIEIDVKVNGAKQAKKSLKGLGTSGKEAGGKTTKELKGTKKEMKKLGKEAKKTTSGFKKLKGIGSTIGKGFRGVAKGVAGIAKAGAAAIAALGAALLGLLFSTANRLEKIGNESKKLGFTTEEFQRLEFVAGKVGTSIDIVGRGVKNLGRLFDDAQRTGSGKFLDALERMNIAGEQFDKGPIENLRTMADALAGIEDPSERIQLAMATLGEEAGPELLKAIGEGTVAFDTLLNSMDATEIATDAQIQKAAEFNASMEDIKATLRDVAVEFVEEFLPSAKETVKQFRGWIKENDKLLKQDIPKFIRSMIKSIKSVIGPIVDFIDSMSRLHDEASRLTAGIEKDWPVAWGIAKRSIEFMFSPLARILSLLKLVGLAGDSAADALVNIRGPDETDAEFAARKRSSSKEGRKQKKLDRQRAEKEEAAAEAEAKDDARFVDDLFRKAERFQGREVSKILTKRKGKKFTSAERRQLTELGKSEAEILTLEAQRVKRKSGAKGGKKKDDDKPGVSLAEALLAIRTGTADPQQIRKVIQSLAKKTPSTKSIKPTVAIDYFNFNITQNIKGSSPKQIGDASAVAIRKEFRKANAKAGQDLAPSVVR